MKLIYFGAEEVGGHWSTDHLHDLCIAVAVLPANSSRGKVSKRRSRVGAEVNVVSGNNYEVVTSE